MFCTKCGAKLPKDSKYCVECGVSINEDSNKVSNNTSSTPSFVWAIVGFLVPVAGLILFIMWKEDRPKDSKVAGISALVSTILYVIYMIIMVLVMVLGVIAY